VANNEKSAGSLFTDLMGDFLNAHKTTGFQIEELTNVGEEIKNLLNANKMSTQKTEELIKTFTEQLKSDAEQYKIQTLNVSQIKTRIEDLINKATMSSAKGKDSGVDVNAPSELAKEMKESITATKKLVDTLEELIDTLKQGKFAAGAKISGMFSGGGKNGNNKSSVGGAGNNPNSGANKLGTTITSFFTSRQFWGKFASGIIEGIMGAKMLKKGLGDVIHLGILLLCSWLKKTFGGIPAAIAYIGSILALNYVGGRVVRGALKVGTKSITNPRAVKRLARMKKMQFTRGVRNTLGLLTNPAKMGKALKNAGKGTLDFIMGGGRKVVKGAKAVGSAVVKGGKALAGGIGAVASGAKNLFKGGGKAGAKTATKALGKGLGKAALKKIPVAGLVAGGLFAAQRAMAGDWGGAGLELASGAASTIPGVGTAASIGIDAALMAKDVHDANKGSKPQASSTGGKVFEEVQKQEKKKDEKQTLFWNRLLNALTFLMPIVGVVRLIGKAVKWIQEKFGFKKSESASEKYLKSLGVSSFRSSSADEDSSYNPSSPGDTSTSGLKRNWFGSSFDGKRITTQFGVTDSLHPTGHKGVDLAYNKGDKVGAKVGGIVTYAQKGDNGGYGNLVIVEDDKGYKHYYAHLAKILVAEGQSVGQGATLGVAGSTGHSTGVHLHYEVRKPGQKNQLDRAGNFAIDPLEYVTNYRNEMKRKQNIEKGIPEDVIEDHKNNMSVLKPTKTSDASANMSPINSGRDFGKEASMVAQLLAAGYFGSSVDGKAVKGL